MQERRSITELARNLRKNPTQAEQRLWRMLRHRKLNGAKFLRQRPIIYEQDSINGKQFFIVDFYCASFKLAIEVDGSSHKYRKYYDKQRDQILNELGIRVLRIKNEELNDPVQVRQKIMRALETQIADL